MSETKEKLAPTTLGTAMGEFVWLMSQSPVHKRLTIEDLEWLLMPPLLLSQFKIYYDEAQPIGAVLWGYLNEEAETRLKTQGRIHVEDWGNNATFSAEQGLVAHAGGTLWLIEFLTPFHTNENKHREFILGDLMENALKGKEFKLVCINPKTNKAEEITLGGTSFAH
jgi:cytolysin-activating lysine-acyltransferase